EVEKGMLLETVPARFHLARRVRERRRKKEVGDVVPLRGDEHVRVSRVLPFPAVGLIENSESVAGEVVEAVTPILCGESVTVFFSARKLPIYDGEEGDAEGVQDA